MSKFELNTNTAKHLTNQEEELDAILNRIKARMANNDRRDIYEALIDAVDNEMVAAKGANDYFAIGYRACAQTLKEFNAWVIMRWAEVRKDMLIQENHAKDMLPFYSLGICRVVERDYEHTCGKYFALKKEFELFDGYYPSAVLDESEDSLQKDKPGIDLLWEKFVLFKNSS